MKITKALFAGIFIAGFNFATLNIVTVANADEYKSMTVYKTPWCGCCEGWAKAMEKAGYSVKTVDLDDLSKIKKQSSVTQELAGCHTAVLGDYIIEGHVPLEAIDKLLELMPNIKGIAAPGMPAGSLGMGYDKNAKYDVLAFTSDVTKKPTLFYQAGN